MKAPRIPIQGLLAFLWRAIPLAPPGKRAVTAFAVVFVAFSIYRVIAAPFLEPDFELSENSRPAATPAASGTPPEQEVLQEFAHLLPEDGWEHERVRLLESDRVVLLHQDYNRNDDGSVHLYPVTLVYRLDDPATTPAELRRYLVVRAEQGATLKFDVPFSLRLTKIRKLVSARIRGRIVIYGMVTPGAEPGELYAETEDVRLDPFQNLAGGVQGSKLTTGKLVEFRLGPHHGRGRDLRVTLPERRDGLKLADAIGFSDLSTIELERDVEVHLAADELRDTVGGDPNALASAQPPGLAPRGRRPSVEIRCQGPFIFDARLRTAEFTRNVDVTRDHPAGGASDVLSCDVLKAVLEGESTAGGPKEELAALGKLQLRLIAAQGVPVVFRSPQQQAEVRCEELEYDLAARRLTIANSPTSQVPRAVLSSKGRICEANRISVDLDERGDVVAVSSAGAGMASVPLGDDDELSTIRWGEGLQLKPDGGRDVLSLGGGVEVAGPSIGKLTAAELWLWLRRGAADANSGADVSAGAWVPEQLAAVGGVDIEHPRGSGRAENAIEVWFVPAPPATTQLGAASNESGGLPTTPTIGRPAAAGDSSDRVTFHGQTVQLRVQLGDQPQMTDVAVLEGGVIEQSSSVAGGTQWKLAGDRLAVSNANTPRRTCAAFGAPARVEANGMVLSSSELRFDQGAGRVWAVGPGTIDLPLQQTASLSLVGGATPAIAAPPLAGASSTNEDVLHVAWRQGMDFDGGTARFHEEVSATTASQELRTETLEVDFSPAIDLRSPSAKIRPELIEVRCRGGFWIEDRRYEQQQLAAASALRARELSVNRATGAVHVLGPGEFTYLGKASGASLVGGPLTTPPPGGGKQLTSLRMEFQHRAVGDLHRMSLTCGEHVTAIYGPAQDWNHAPELTALRELGPNEAALNCRELTVRRPPPAVGAPNAFELEARDSVRVEGEKYTALGARLTYSQAKDHLVLEGDGLTDAQVWQETSRAGDYASTTARRIEMWPKNNVIKVDDFRSAEGTVGSAPPGFPSR